MELSSGRRIAGGGNSTFTLDAVDFKKFGELWMPVKFHCVSELVNVGANGHPGMTERIDYQFRVTDLQLAPDFKTGHTFEPTFLPEGAALRFDNGQQNVPAYQNVVWKQGRFVTAPAGNTPAAQTSRGRQPLLCRLRVAEQQFLAVSFGERNANR